MPPTLPPPRLVDNGIDDADARRLIDWIRWWRPFKATRQSAASFRHPWNITARWNAGAERWEARIEAGYVNGQEVETPLPLSIDDSPTATLSRGSQRPWLSESPWLPVRAGLFREVGADEAEAIPLYFLQQGVRPADADSTTSDAFGLTTNLGGTLEDRAQARRLMAVDILLSQPRPRLETVTERGPNGARTLVMSLTTPTGSDAAPRVSLRRESSDPEPVEATIAALLAAGETDDGLDRLRLGTLYLLSPPGKTGAAPDGEWQATPRNEVFWNLNYAVTADVSAIPPLRLNLGAAGALAGGVAQGFLGQTLADIAAADAAAAAFLSRGRIEGRFWSI